MVAGEVSRLDRVIRVMELMGEIEAERDQGTGGVTAYRRTGVPSPVLDGRPDSTGVQLGECQSSHDDNAVRKRGTASYGAGVSFTVRMVIAMGAVLLAASLGCDALPSRAGPAISVVSVLDAPSGQGHPRARAAQ